tara:strand:+ start:348 stop:572 length:225 start_codon:yes stop_codon:yes gene_type:complete
MSIHNYTKQEIIDQLQFSEYMRDELHFGVKDLGRMLDVNVDGISDEELMDNVMSKFITFVNNLPDEYKVELKQN